MMKREGFDVTRFFWGRGEGGGLSIYLFTPVEVVNNVRIFSRGVGHVLRKTHVKR